MLIVVDGRIGEEKLLELLAHGGECAELDFKETLDLTSRKDELSFVKDAISMHNNYPGGYIIVGACDDGSPSDICLDLNWSQFDGRKLTDKVRRYVDALPEITSQHHCVDGHEYCLICVMSLPDGLPIPFSKDGQGAGNKLAFRRGDIFVRDGSGNDVVKHSQWGKILQQYERRIREDERSHINTLISRISDALTEHGKTPPLFPGMEDDALVEALDRCFEANDTRKISVFITKLKNTLNSGDEAMSDLTAVGSFAALYDDWRIFEQVIDVLYDFYCGIEPWGDGDPYKRLEVATAVYVIGASAVRSKRWKWILPLVNKQGGLKTGYIYASWIRECQVSASRSNVFDDEEQGMLISHANKLVAEHESFKPDVLAMHYDKSNGDQLNDVVLDSLCAFDMLFCICVNAVGEGHGGAYPSCALFKDERVAPVARALLSSDSKVRRELLPGCSDEDVANAFRQFWTEATRQSMQHGIWQWDLDGSGVIQSFLKEHLIDE